MFARGSASMIILPAMTGAILAVLGFWIMCIFFVLFTLLMLGFFRDPDRAVGKGIVSGADGTVDYVKTGKKWTIISVFMNLHNVHVNRAPLDGKVLSVTRKPGGRFPAFLKRSEKNSRASIVMETEIGIVRVVMISGVFAWRVCPYIRAGDSVKKGQRIGIIRFGSRVNVWLPTSSVQIAVEKGYKTKAGETTIAEVLR